MDNPYKIEVKIVRNTTDEIIFRRLKLYKRIEADNLARIAACRDQLSERYPEISSHLDEYELIEDAIEKRNTGSAGKRKLVQDGNSQDKSSGEEIKNNVNSSGTEREVSGGTST